MAIILGFDVSQGYCSVALSREDKIVAYNKLLYVSQQAEMLIPTIELTLAQAQLSYNDLNYIATTVGPGSFTGIRIGLAAAQGLLLSISAKPIAVNNFDTIAYRVREQVSSVDNLIAIINAYRDECYYQVFDNKFVATNSFGLINNHDINQLISSLDGNIYCAGSGVLKIIPHVMTNHATTQQSAAPQLKSADKEIKYLPRFPMPDARIICKAAYQKIMTNCYSTELNPLYIRKADAKPNIKQNIN